MPHKYFDHAGMTAYSLSANGDLIYASGRLEGGERIPRIGFSVRRLETASYLDLDATVSDAPSLIWMISRRCPRWRSPALKIDSIYNVLPRGDSWRIHTRGPQSVPRASRNRGRNLGPGGLWRSGSRFD